MAGPSASGSLDGTPKSMTAAPASASASTNFSVAASDGSPAVMNATRPISLCWRSSAKRRAMRVVEGAAGVAEVFMRGGGSENARENLHIFIAASGDIHDDK